MTTKRRGWFYEELLIVFRLYCRTPFGRLHKHNPDIIETAKLLGRTPSAVGMKACNFASLDPQQKARNIKALGNVSSADRQLWESFLDNSEAIAQQAEAAYFTMTRKIKEEYLPELGFIQREEKEDQPLGETTSSGSLPFFQGPTEKAALIKARCVQSFFRAAVLISYNNRCGLTGLAIPELLNASHIIPWSVDEKRRADPRNGICLNALHDRAFDRGLISFDENLRVIVSKTINNNEECELHCSQLVGISGRPLRLPERFQPEKEALEYHRTYIYRS
jgi:predicted restriction endonuclease